ncbi:MAG: hypothetical protein QOJ03_3426 [Frankiaceae bacterium]|jgi:hypothetical protein|nr:hypothetical protein [Frankiaceae bacterium]
MGRGRAKAKQTKVARQLKYSSGGTDLERLQRELSASRGDAPADVPVDTTVDDETDDYDDPYALDDEDDDEDEPAAKP